MSRIRGSADFPSCRSDWVQPAPLACGWQIVCIRINSRSVCQCRLSGFRSLR